MFTLKLNLSSTRKKKDKKIIGINYKNIKNVIQIFVLHIFIKEKIIVKIIDTIMESNKVKLTTLFQ